MIRALINGVMLVVSATVLVAQAPTRYDRAGETTLAGAITAVVAFPAADGSVGVHLDLKTSDGRIVSVHVGPAAYVGQQNFWFFADDRVEVVGTRTIVDDNVSIWAKAVQKGSDTLVLRHADGTTKWTPEGDGIDGCGVNHLPLPRATER